MQRLRLKAPRIASWALLYLTLAIGTVAVLFPVAWMIGASFKPDPEIMSARLNPIPLTPTLNGYRLMAEQLPLVRNAFNSVFVATTGTLLSLFLTSLGGYAFAKYDFPGNRPLFFFLLATMMVPYEVSLVPSYLIMVKLHWINTYTPLIIPGAASAWGIFMMRQYIASVPTEMLEAARIDGSSEFGIYWQIVMPVIQPALAAWGILGFVGTWNDFLWPMIILRSREMFTLMVAVASMPTARGFDTPWSVIMAGATVAVLPLMVLYAAGQRFFESGLTMGALHG
jgi:ABC-type glycerol-3-phosphate transport system permease component